MLNGAVKRLRTTNQLKEGMERVIIDQCMSHIFDIKIEITLCVRAETWKLYFIRDPHCNKLKTLIKIFAFLC